jgi:hypothetical protein
MYKYKYKYEHRYAPSIQETTLRDRKEQSICYYFENNPVRTTQQDYTCYQLENKSDLPAVEFRLFQKDGSLFSHAVVFKGASIFVKKSSPNLAFVIVGINLSGQADQEVIEFCRFVIPDASHRRITYRGGHDCEMVKEDILC